MTNPGDFAEDEGDDCESALEGATRIEFGNGHAASLSEDGTWRIEKSTRGRVIKIAAGLPLRDALAHAQNMGRL